MAIANFTPLPTLPTPPNTQTDTKPIFLQKADAFNPALKGWADNFNSGTVPTLNDLIALLNQQLPYINTVADSDKAIRAIYADLSSIISVSEGIDSVQTVAEQISGVKDIADNLTEVLAAKGYAEDAKKWALIAESVANIGPATPEKIGLVKPDAVTTHITEDGTITAKDVAIGGDLGDLASARGQVGDAKEMPNLDFNTLTTPGNYRITGNPTNGPSLPLNISGASIGSLIVAGIPGQNGRIFQIMISGSTVTWRTVQNSTGTTWSAWQQLLSGNKVGDGIRVTNGIISVPEMQGATASKAGTSGLVPPAAAGQHESFLTGGGEYKPALTKISDSVSLEDSKTAASATAVKTAYDAAQSKLPLSGGTLTGALRSKPGNIHVASTPSADEVDDALYLVDANGVVYANLQSTNYANGSMLVGLAVNTSVKGGSGGWQTLKIGADKTGKFISHVPTPDLSDASDNIANTVYVQENLKSYLKLAGGILTGDVTVPSVNGYQVVDHEVNGGWYFFPENFYNSGRNGRFLTKAGLKVQYGGVSGMSDVTQQVTFAEPFSTIPIVITTSESSGIEQITVPLGVTTTGFSLGHMSAGTQTGTVFKHWIAIGR